MIDLREGDCLKILTEIAPSSIDACVTDPPYHLTSIVERFGKEGSAPAQEGSDGRFARASRGFMGKVWDGGDVAFRPTTWALVHRTLKPGAHLLAFGGTRTFHRMACAIEDAGFEIRDMVAWMYGSGFPKSHDIGEGWGTALKPALEPVVLARKPISEKTVAANFIRWGTGGLNIEDARVPMAETIETTNGSKNEIYGDLSYNAGEEWKSNPAGRWPANLVHDGSDEVIGAFPNVHGAGNARVEPGGGQYQGDGVVGFGAIGEGRAGFRYGDASGSAARFYYSAKAEKDDRLGSKHPTVKPISLMIYLIRLITPKGGLVLDPFAGTGSTGEAAIREGCRALLIEREPQYIEDIRRRISLLRSGRAERLHASIKASGKTESPGPLFE